MSASDLTSLLLEVFRGRSARRTPPDLLAQALRDRSVQPTADDPRDLLRIEAHAFAAASAFAPTTLSPVAPLGLNVALGDIDQNSTLAAARNLEVLADPTTMMALETARQRQHGDAVVRLCAAGRMLRLQPVDNPAFSRHFALFALTSGGRARAAHGFELEALEEHLAAHLTLLDRLATDGFRLDELRVEVADTEGDAAGRLAAVEARVFPSLQARFPRAVYAIDRARTHAMQYYRGLCLHILARDVDGAMQQLSDGGGTDWAARLLSNGKERFFASGIGTELLLRRFR